MINWCVYGRLVEQKEVLESLVAKQTPELERAAVLKTTSAAAVMKYVFCQRLSKPESSRTS